jgi:hypothetical protein
MADQSPAPERSVRAAASELANRGQRGAELAEAIRRLGDSATKTPAWSELLAVLDWEKTLGTEQLTYINQAWDELEEQRRPVFEAADNAEYTHLVSDAARWLEQDPLWAAETALAAIEKADPGQLDIQLAASTVVALACLKLGMHQSSSRYSRQASHLGLQLLGHRTG